MNGPGYEKSQSVLHDRLASHIFLRRLGRNFFSACLRFAAFYSAANPDLSFSAAAFYLAAEGSVRNRQIYDLTEPGVGNKSVAMLLF